MTYKYCLLDIVTWECATKFFILILFHTSATSSISRVIWVTYKYEYYCLVHNLPIKMNKKMKLWYCNKISHYHQRNCHIGIINFQFLRERRICIKGIELIKIMEFSLHLILFFVFYITSLLSLCRNSRTPSGLNKRKITQHNIMYKEFLRFT